MGIEEKIKALLLMVVDRHGGNKSAAASSLNANTVTFWSWVEGRRGLNKALCDVIDRAGGVLLLPGEGTATDCHRCQNLEKEIDTLNAEIGRLKAKNEAYLEAISAQAAAQSKAEVDQRPPLQALAKGQIS